MRSLIACCTVVVFLVGARVDGAVAHVQTIFGQTNGSATTVAVTATTTASNAVTVTLILNNSEAGVASLAQTTGDTLTSCATIDNSGIFQRQYTATSIAGGSTTYTFTWTNATLASIFVTEWTGVTSSPCDKTASTNYAIATTHSSGTTATLTQAAEVCYASFNGDGSGTTGGVSMSNSYTIPTNGNKMGSGITGVRSLVAYLIVSATTACETTMTSDNAAASGLMGTYKASAAAAGARPAIGLLSVGR